MLHYSELRIARPTETGDVLRVDRQRDVLLTRCHVGLEHCQQAPRLPAQDVGPPITFIGCCVSLPQPQGVTATLDRIRRRSGALEIGFEIAVEFCVLVNPALREQGKPTLMRALAELREIAVRRVGHRNASVETRRDVGCFVATSEDTGSFDECVGKAHIDARAENPVLGGRRRWQRSPGPPGTGDDSAPAVGGIAKVVGAAAGGGFGVADCTAFRSSSCF